MPTHPESQPIPVDREAAAELRGLADIAIKGKLCSLLFPDFMEHFRRDVNREPTGAVIEITAMIRTAHTRGSHYTPDQIAGILCGRAAQIERGERMRRYR